MKELIDDYVFYYGGSKTNAAKILKQFNKTMKNELLKGYRHQTKQTFIVD